MKRNEIDKAYKKGLLEWEKSNDASADLAKERVWQAIMKPGKNRKLYWVIIGSVAASLLLLLVSGFLFLKLEHKQKELLALQAKIDSNTSIPIKPEVENPVNDKPESKPEEIQKEEESLEVPIIKSDKVPTLDHGDLLAEIRPEELQYIAPIQESEKELAVPNLVPETLDFLGELPKTALFIPELNAEKELPLTNPKPQRKIKIGLGKGQQSQNPQNTLALNIKL